MATLATRVISGRGLLRIPASADLRKAKRLSLYVDVIRLPFNQYRNNNYNLPKSRYGTINLYKTGYLEQELCIEYPRQAFHFYPDPSAQVFYLAKCIYANLAEALELGFAGAGSPVSLPNTFEDWYHTTYWWDEAKIVCYADAALQLVVESEEFLLCEEDEDPQPPPPPPPPPNPPDVPPGTSLGDDNTPISDPYQEPDDGGDTVPYPGDDFPEPPQEFPIGNQCDVYTVAVTATVVAGGSVQNNSISVFGKVEFVGLDPSNPNQIIITAYGDALAPSAFCRSSPQTIVLLGSSSGYVPGSFSYTVTP